MASGLGLTEKAPGANSVRVAATYEASGDALWRHVVRYDALERMMSGPLVRVRGPAGEEAVGDDVVLVFRLFGVLPIGGWRFKVLARDDARLYLKSEESGTAVRRWTHEVTIERIDDRSCRLIDTIDIDAGALTPLVVWFASREYARRHRLRKRLLRAAQA